MPPKVAFLPVKICRKYPLCTNKTKRGSTGERLWTHWCASCGDAPLCQHQGCTGHAAPDIKVRSKKWSAHGRCSDHVADVAYNIDREWSLCSNRDNGCRQLAMKKGGGKRYACGARWLPCVHALEGCPTYASAS